MRAEEGDESVAELAGDAKKTQDRLDEVLDDEKSPGSENK